jgi:hypothetical protein
MKSMEGAKVGKMSKLETFEFLETSGDLKNLALFLSKRALAIHCFA